MTNLPDIVSFCDMNCLNNWLIDEFEDAHVMKKEDVLDSIAYHQQRDEL